MGTLRSDSAGRTGWFYSFFLANISNGGTAPLIPIYLVVAFSGTIFQVGLITAATSMASIPAYIIWGNLSDHLHRRKLFIVQGFAGLAVSMAAMWLSADFAMFFVANLLLGLLYTACAPAGTALLIEQTPRQHWASYLGRFSRVGGTGYLFGLIAGAAWFTFIPPLTQYMRLFFVFSTVVAVAGTAMALALVRDGEEHKQSHEHRRGNHWNSSAAIPIHISERAKYLPGRLSSVIRLATPSAQERKEVGGMLRRYYLVTALFSTGFVTFYTVLPNYLTFGLARHVALGESVVFIVYIGSSLASTMTYGKVSGWAAGRGEKRLQSVAAGARVLIIPLFFVTPLFLAAQTEVVAAMIALNAVMGFCWAIINVTGQSMVASMAGPHIRGEAMGLYNSAIGIGSIAGAVLGGIVTQGAGYGADFLLSSLFVLSGVLLLHLVRSEVASPGTANQAAAGSPAAKGVESSGK